MTDADRRELLEIYKLFAETTQRVSENRLKTNVYFISINGLLFGANGVFSNGVLGFCLLLFAIGVNLVWLQLIDSSRKLNAAKFTVIKELEKRLSFDCFTKEQECYHKEGRRSFSSLERWCPQGLILLYVLILFVKWGPVICSWVCGLSCSGV